MIAVDTAATRGCGERQQLFVCFEDLGVNDSLGFSRLPQHHTYDASKRVVRGDPLGGRGERGEAVGAALPCVCLVTMFGKRRHHAVYHENKLFKLSCDDSLAAIKNAARPAGCLSLRMYPCAVYSWDEASCALYWSPNGTSPPAEESPYLELYVSPVVLV